MTKHTGNLYTINTKSASLPSRPERARVEWVGNSHDVLVDFPPEVRQNLGKALQDVQEGRRPPDSGPVPGIGRSGVFELRDEDADAWYRLIHLKKIDNRIFVLHCFEKETNKIDKQDIRTIKARLAAVEELLRREKQNA